MVRTPSIALACAPHCRHRSQWALPFVRNRNRKHRAAWCEGRCLNLTSVYCMCVRVRETRTHVCFLDENQKRLLDEMLRWIQEEGSNADFESWLKTKVVNFDWQIGESSPLLAPNLHLAHYRVALMWFLMD